MCLLCNRSLRGSCDILTQMKQVKKSMSVPPLTYSVHVNSPHCMQVRKKLRKIYAYMHVLLLREQTLISAI